MPKKKVVKKKNPRTANKQRQNVNVKIKIDQSRRTNPREPRQAAKGSLPSRAYTANSSTPLHTTIMTASPFPANIYSPPPNAPNGGSPPNPPNPPDDRNDRITRMIDDLDFRTNRQLNLLTDDLSKIVRTQQPQLQQQEIAELYNAMLKEHIARQPQQLPQGFQDPNAKAPSKLQTPAKPQEPAQAVAPTQEPEWVDEHVKRRRGRPKDTDEQKALKALIKEEARKKIQYENLKKVANTRANQKAGLASPLVGQKQEPKITKYFQTQKEAEEEQKKLKALEDKLNEEARLKREARRSARKQKKQTARNKKLDKTFSNIFAQTSGDEM